ncbi:MAG: ATP12 family protein [Paracoccus sp. (in: a-proteobacteria)]|nr:ATP12 family protein [Paracoccus sp. (in: a-proteobacteria)]
MSAPPTSNAGGWAARRFWTKAEARDTPDGWQVALDDRLLRTPGKLPLILPTRVLAEAVAAEWAAQGDLIRPETMPLTRAANSAIERVTPQRAEVAAMLAGYAPSDLLCHRAERPARLVAAQAEGWDGLMDWCADRYGARLVHAPGIMPIAQDPQALARLEAAVASLGPFALTALHDLVTLPGSLVLGLAVIDGRLTADEAHALSRIDEDHQARDWGRDDEAEAAAAARLEALRHAETFWHLLGDDRASRASV